MANTPTIQTLPSVAATTNPARNLEGQIVPYQNALDKLPRASFTPNTTSTKLEFPYERCRYRSEYRLTPHEYLHADGAQLEHQGRKIWVVTFDGVFFDSFKLYPKLYPYTLDAIATAFMAGTKGVLVCPSPVIGAIQATCKNYDGVIDAKVRSGERVTLEFWEDRDDDFTIDQLVQVSTNALANVNSTLQAMSGSVSAPTATLFSQLNTAVNAVLAIKDQGDLQLMLLESKLQWIAGLCSTIDNTIELRDPALDNVMQAVHDVWGSAIQGINDLLNQRSPIQTYVLTVTMSAAQVAGLPAVYGDSTRVDDIIQLNPWIDDPYAIPAGSTIQFIPSS